MTQEIILVPSKLIQRPTNDFKALPELGRAGGTSPDSQFFAEDETQALWIGKCSVQAMSKPQSRSPGGIAHEEYKEWLGLAIYRLLGIITPITQLSVQPVIKPTEGAVDDFDYEHPCVHIMSKFVEGFTPFGETFLERYHQMAAQSEHSVLVSGTKNADIPLQGFGATLAVACFIYNLDCLGRTGRNMGYVVGQDKDGKPCAQTVKIDPGFAFSFLENFDDVSYSHDPRQRDIRYAPGRVAKDQACILRYDQLHPSDQQEFACTALKILQIPGSIFKALIDQVVCKDGFTAQQAGRLLNELLARKSIFMAGYASKVSRTLQAEVEDALGEMMLLVKPSIQVSKAHPLEEAPLLSDLKDLKYVYKYSSLTEPTEDRKKRDVSISSSPFLTQSIAPDDDTEVKLNTSSFLKKGLPSFLIRRSSNNHILMTSRNPDWPDIPTLPLGGLSSEEARLYVRQRLPKAYNSEIDALVASVSNLPLALSHAVAYIVEGHCTLADYPSQFALHQLSLGRLVVHTERANHTVLSTFLLTVARLQREHPCASLILQTAAYLAPEGIPVSLLHTELAKQQSVYSAQQLQQGITVLTRHALLQPGKDGHLDIHRLVQQIIRNQLSLTEQHLRLSAILQLVGQAYPEEGECNTTDAARKIFIPHLKALIEQQGSSGRKEDTHLARVLFYLGSAYKALGDVAKKRDLLLRALKIDEAHYGSDHCQLAPTLVNLGNAYGALGEVTKKRELLERALKIKEAHYGPDHWQLATTLASLGDAYGDLGEVVQQRDLLLRALKIKEARYGSNHWQLAPTLGSLGNAYGALGDAKQSFKLLQRALEIQEAHYSSSDHWQLTPTLTNLAIAYGCLGYVIKKRDLLERALKIDEAHYGADYWQLAHILINLGNAYGYLGDVIKKRNYLLRALKLQEARYGSAHPAVALTLANLAVAYKTLKETKAALHAAQGVYRIMVFHPHYGEQNPLTKRYLNYLQSQGFTLEQLRTPPVQTGKEDQKQIPSISTILPAIHFAPPRRGSTSNKKDPGQGQLQDLRQQNGSPEMR